MWKCKGCGEEIDDVFDACWQCGTNIDGVRDPEFRHADVPPDEVHLVTSVAWEKLCELPLVVPRSDFPLILGGVLVLMALSMWTLLSMLLDSTPPAAQDGRLFYLVAATPLASTGAFIFVALAVPMRLELDLTVRVRCLFRTLEFDRADIESVELDRRRVVWWVWSIPVVEVTNRRIVVHCKSGRKYTLRISAASESQLRRVTTTKVRTNGEPE